jgi:hypothetical protein
MRGDGRLIEFVQPWQPPIQVASVRGVVWVQTGWRSVLFVALQVLRNGPANEFGKPGTRLFRQGFQSLPLLLFKIDDGAYLPHGHKCTQ